MSVDWSSELATVQAAPIAYLVVLVPIALGIWAALNWRYKGIIEKLKGVIDGLKEDNTRHQARLKEYRENVGAGSPTEVGARIKRLEDTIRYTVGSEWEPLKQAQIDLLATQLSKLQKHRVQLMYRNRNGRALAESFRTAFEKAGWTVPTFVIAPDFENGIFVGPQWEETGKIRSIVEETTGLSVSFFG